MFDELDELLKLTKLVEATSTNNDTEQPKEDLPAAIRTYDDGDYSGKGQVLRTVSEADVPQPPKDGKAFGSSGNPTYTDKHGQPLEDGPLFEDDGPTDNPPADAGTQQTDASDGQADDSPSPEELEKASEASTATSDGVNEMTDTVNKLAADVQNEEGGENVPNGAPADTQAMHNPVRNALKRSFSIGFGESVERGMGTGFVNRYLFESGSGCCYTRNNPFKLGDAVQVQGIPRIFIVKNADGNMSTTAKPTNCQADFAKGKDGVWPEYCFQCDELSKLDNADLSQADDIAEFNDQDIQQSGFNGLTIDPGPMELAQEYARERTMDDVADDLDEILGAYRSAASGNDNEFSYTKCSPVTTFVYPNGQVTTQCIEGGYEKFN